MDVGGQTILCASAASTQPSNCETFHMRTRTAIRLANIAFNRSLHRRGWLIIGCLAAIVAAAVEFPPRSVGQAFPPKQIRGVTVVAVDGDTLKFDGTRVRIHGIDAPERKQMCARGTIPYACGEAATTALAELIHGGQPECRIVDQDKYGRPVAICYLGQLDIGRWLVEKGMAVADRNYAPDYVAEEKAAAAAGRGIWSTKFVDPWIWRQQQTADKS